MTALDGSGKGPYPDPPAGMGIGVDLYWLPLGAGGRSVRLCGRTFERVVAMLERRSACDLYHSALEIWVPAGRYVIEMTPIPDGHGVKRGVSVEGAVGSSLARHLRVFRYEVRRWHDGVIADVREAVASPVRLTDDPHVSQRVLDLVPELPAPGWGRDALGAGEMWNSNSVIAWLLVRAGLLTDAVRPPGGGRAPGWRAGVEVGQRPRPS